MLKQKYQQGDLSLVHIDFLPQALPEGKSETNLVLSKDINENAYIISSNLEEEGRATTPVLYCLGKAKYLQVKVPAVLNHPDRTPVSVEPGLYKVKRDSEYIHTEHGREVATYALLIGKALGFDEQHLKELEFASRIHDIGVAELEETLWKTQWFGDDEWEKIKQHPARGARVVENLIGRLPYATERVKEYVLYHHEHIDGSGYPTGLASDAIPLGARAILIADAFHAMISWRPFREPLPEHVALDRLMDDAGYRYDRELVNIFSVELQNALSVFDW